MVKAESLSASKSSQHGGAYDFFTFYNQLQQSCAYYSNLALRQMMVGYQNPVGVVGSPISTQTQQSNNKVNDRKINGVEVAEKMGKSLNDYSTVAETYRYSPPNVFRKPTVRVIVSDYDGDDNETDAAVNNVSPSRQRKVNFANPLSTIKIKSPTPIHSMEELSNGHGDAAARTGFTSDSEVEGSDTDILCSYVHRVQNEEQGQLEIPAGGTGAKKRKKRRKKNKNGKRAIDVEEGNEFDFQEEWCINTEQGFYGEEEEDDNEVYEMPLNEDDYEFVSEIRLCGAPKDKSTKVSEERGQEEDRSKEMKQLYGELGSVRILKMEDTIEQCFKQSLNTVSGRK